MNNKPRRPWIAAILTLVTRGLGHLYAGEPTRGFILFAVEQILFLVFAVLVIVIMPNATFLILAVSGGFAFVLFCAADAARIARKKKEHYELARYNRWFAYLGYFISLSLLLSSLISGLIKTNLVEAYKISSGSMMPTLLNGDHLLANKYIYKITEPKRGDILIFPYPEDPKRNFVNRLIAIAGDVLELRDNQLYLNGIKQEETYLFRNVNNAGVDTRGNFGPITVLPGMLFFLGDNRERSLDSRVYGFVPRNSIKGKVLSLYWSWDNENHRVRWDRIGQLIK